MTSSQPPYTAIFPESYIACSRRLRHICCWTTKCIMLAGMVQIGEFPPSWHACAGR